MKFGRLTSAWIEGEQVVKATVRISSIRATLTIIIVDNRPELITKKADRRMSRNDATLDFSRLSKPFAMRS